MPLYWPSAMPIGSAFWTPQHPVLSVAPQESRKAESLLSYTLSLHFQTGLGRLNSAARALTDAASLFLGFPGFINDGIELGHRLKASKAYATEATHVSILMNSSATLVQLWAENVGIISLERGELADKHSPNLDHPEVLERVRAHLKRIRELQNKLHKAIAKIGVDDEPKIQGSKRIWSHSPLPSRKGIQWGFGKAEAISDDLQKLDKHVEKLHQLVPPEASKSSEASTSFGMSLIFDLAITMIVL